MNGEILGVSAPMFTSVASGIALLTLTLVLFWIGLTRRGKKPVMRHRTLAWVVMAAAALHGAWGIIAVFVLKS